ncbi:1,8-cineole synthase 2 [Cardamine amara subsp. amara]|uniref:1,8-cineole synthase 2 n=1 Tax=Cardamine amara subsp. amara TaxID=228776 RepID=A0ABD0ZSQ1_CARAN
MQNAWISISAPTILVHFYSVFSDQISIQILESLPQHRQHFVRCSPTILRLANHLGTSPMNWREVTFSNWSNVTCMKPKLRRQRHVHTWDEVNYETKTACNATLLPRGFVEAAMNLARMSQCMYQFGDGHGCPNKAKTVDRVQSLPLD